MRSTLWQHTAWGSFWVGWGILELLVTLRVLPPIPLGVASPSFAFWFIALTLVTFPGARATDPIAYRAGMPGVRVGQ